MTLKAYFFRELKWIRTSFNLFKLSILVPLAAHGLQIIRIKKPFKSNDLKGFVFKSGEPDSNLRPCAT